MLLNPDYVNRLGSDVEAKSPLEGFTALTDLKLVTVTSSSKLLQVRVCVVAFVLCNISTDDSTMCLRVMCMWLCVCLFIS